MKKFNILLSIILCLFLSGCAVTPSTDEDNNPPDAGDAPVDDAPTPTPEVEASFDELFSLNNKITINIDITPEQLALIQSDYETYSQKNSKSPIYRMANLTITINDNSYYYEEVGIRMKGNTSRNSFYSSSQGIYSLIHFKISFTETFDGSEYSTPKTWNTTEERDLRKSRTFAGLEKLDLKWNKSQDKTYTKEIFAYKTYEEFGLLAPKQTLANVNIRNKGSMESIGVYMLSEVIDKLFLERRLTKAELGGDLYKASWGSGVGASLSAVNYYGIEDEDVPLFYTYDLKTNKKTSTHSQLKNMLSSLNTSSFTTYVDINYFIKYMAVNFALGTPDDMRFHYNNYYIYFLNNTNKAIFIPYDLDRCLGITKDWNPSGDGMTGYSIYTTATTDVGSQVNPLVLKTVTEAASRTYQNQYKAALTEIINSSWFTASNFRTFYSLAQANYHDCVKPSINVSNPYVSFSFTEASELNRSDANISIEVYLDKIKENIRKYL